MSMRDMKFDEILYSHFPNIYKDEDAKLLPEPFPLKRFIQITSVGFEKVKSEIEGLQMLFDVDNMPAKYLDNVGRMMGINFHENTKDFNKRRILKNLPLMYKLKGNLIVYDVLTKVVFGNNSRSNAKYTYFDDRTELTVEVEVESSLGSIEELQDIFLELLQLFRPVNVILVWNYHFVDHDYYEFKGYTTTDILTTEGELALLNANLLNSTMVLSPNVISKKTY